MQKHIEIREIRIDDDFDAIERLFYYTNYVKKHKAIEAENMIEYRKENWQQFLFPKTEEEGREILKTLKTKGCILIEDGIIKAMATVGISPSSLNGYFEYGCAESYESYIGELLNNVCHILKIQGGSKLYKTTSLFPGQIRNDDITYWEGYGFRTNDYYHSFVNHPNLLDWVVPDDLDITGIHPATETDIPKIIRILEEDNEAFLAEDFRSEYPNYSPEHVFLLLNDKNSAETAGIAYYKVWAKNDSYIALTFGIHFRPNYNLSRQEIKRFVQATLASMKQLEVTAAWSRISSQSFYLLIELFAEGFEPPPSNTVVLVKSV